MKRWCRLWGPKKTSFQKITWELLYQYLCDIDYKNDQSKQVLSDSGCKSLRSMTACEAVLDEQRISESILKNLLRGFVSDWASLVQIVKKTDQTRSWKSEPSFLWNPGLKKGRLVFFICLNKVAEKIWGEKPIPSIMFKGSIEARIEPI